MAIATTCGADHIRFVLDNGWKPKNYQDPVERFKSIVEPAVKLWGVDYSVGEREGTEYPHMLGSAINLHRVLGKLKKMDYPILPENYITITLRKSRWPERDSKEIEWMKFANKITCKVVILKDYDQVPITLEDRMKLYAGAKMNLMVMHGPVTLCLHSDAPYLCMRTIGSDKSGSTAPEFSKKNGITPGFQFPWRNKRQRHSYLDDTAENIEKEYLAMGDI